MIGFGTRHATLWQVARRFRDGEQAFDPAVREFLDHFYTNPDLRDAAIAGCPDRIDALHDAYLAAVAEHLARSFDLAVPAWTEEQGNDLHVPFFAGGLEALKGVLLAESPTAFRRRLLFISKDALSRPRSP